MNIKQYLVAGLMGVTLAAPSLAESGTTIGWIEKVQLPVQDITFTAKIDTGADHSSIHATDVEIYEHNSIKRVRFSVENKQGASRRFDLPLVRITSIKQKRAGAEPIQRPVVSMDLCVGNILKTTLVNLSNRNNFQYRMLIGRSYLENDYLVNPGKQFTSQPNCEDAEVVLSAKPGAAEG